MKGFAGFLVIAAVIYVFWITLEYIYGRRQNKNNNKNE